MPRTGGVYSPPAGTKGVPNTTIQSVPYNTLIDDLTADANAPRPVTAGGTGATSASGARTALGVEIGSNVQAYDAALQSIAGQTTVANQILYTTATDAYATTALTPLARDLVGDATAAAMKTRLGLAAVASSGSATDLTTGTLPEVRLPNVINGAKTWTGLQIVSVGAATTATDYIQLKPMDYGPGKPLLFLKKDAGANTWGVGLWDGSGSAGILNVAAGTVNFGGATLTAGVGTFSGNLTSSGAVTGNTGLYSLNGDIVNRGSGNKHIWFQTPAGVVRGLLYHDNNGTMNINVYNTSGTFLYTFNASENGFAAWTGQVFIIGGGNGSTESRIYTNDGTKSYRTIGLSSGEIHIQRSTDRFVGNATSLLYFNAANDGVFASNVYGSTFQASANGTGAAFKVGDDAWIGDINLPNTMSVKGVSDFSSGFIRFGAGIASLGVFSWATDRLYYGPSFFMQTDGNMYCPMWGDTLYNVVGGKASVYTGGARDELNFPIGHTILVTSSSGYDRNSVLTVYLATNNSQYGMTPNGSPLGGTYRARGVHTSVGPMVERTA
ncbi:hypothetical protein [Ensifer sp. ENS09]|uniref:hypothetical protein n=1 Tax=Ensifer sp. ENS09 TaxID=2769263 RepID=UPI001FEEB87D|nr:hypothetical protein [Ensifer sp. ENS09]